jgi:uncharacterized membrane protein YkvA (DUF1232 family)
MKKFWIILGCIVYVICPIDLIPDFILGLGQIDDLAAVVMTLVSVFGSDKKRLPKR